MEVLRPAGNVCMCSIYSTGACVEGGIYEQSGTDGAADERSGREVFPGGGQRLRGKLCAGGKKTGCTGRRGGRRFYKMYCTWEKGRVRRKAPETGNEDRGGREAPVRAL